MNLYGLGLDFWCNFPVVFNALVLKVIRNLEVYEQTHSKAYFTVPGPGGGCCDRHFYSQSGPDSAGCEVCSGGCGLDVGCDGVGIPDDARAGFLLRRHGQPEECPFHDDEECGGSRCGWGPLDRGWL